MHVKSATGGLIAGLVLAGSAIAVAPSASAETLVGTFTATITQLTPPDPSAIGKTMRVMLNPCGPTCTNLLSDATTAFFGDLQQQGNLSVGTVTSGINGGTCTGTVDNVASTLLLDCPGEPLTVTYTLSRA